VEVLSVGLLMLVALAIASLAGLAVVRLFRRPG
jgi:hypothetical protein